MFMLAHTSLLFWVHGHPELPLYWDWLEFFPSVKLQSDYVAWKMSPEASNDTVLRSKWVKCQFSL